MKPTVQYDVEAYLPEDPTPLRFACYSKSALIAQKISLRQLGYDRFEIKETKLT